MKIVDARTIVVGTPWRELALCFAVPERPGLGLRLNHEACAAHPRTGGRIRLFEQGWERRGFGRP
jgi:hypothetical protein